MRAEVSEAASSPRLPALALLLGVAALVVVSIVAGCANTDDSPCASTAECFKGQVCVEERCVDPSEGGTTGREACQVATGTTCSDDAVDRAQNDEMNPGPGDDTYQDGVMLTKDDAEQTGCPVDETFRPRPKQHLTQRAKCADDPADYVRLQVTPCKSREVVLLAAFKPEQACSESLVRFVARYNGKELACGEDNTPAPAALDCTVSADGTRNLKVTLNPAGVKQITYISFGVETDDREDIQFTYDLSVEVK